MKHWIAGALLTTAALGAHAAQTTRYAVLVDNGKPAGHQVVTRGDDGTYSVDWLFKDNGRGPELKETFRLADDGTLDFYEGKGTSTFGAPVEERFERKGGTASWHSTSEDGTSPSAAHALYTTLNGSPASSAVAIGALAKRKDGKLPLLPSGALTAKSVQRVDVGTGANRRSVELLVATGQDLTPGFVWSTTGDDPRLFALIVPGYLQLIEEGYEKDADTLQAAQQKAEQDELLDRQRRLGHALPGQTLIRNVRVFDSRNATLGGASDVLLRDGRIESIVPASTKMAAAQRVIDGGGRVLLPGLFDMHAHFDPWQGGLEIATGVTTVRDMGNDNETLLKTIEQEKSGAILAPRIVPAGFLEGESKMSARNGFVVSDLAAAKKAVDWYAAHGYPQIKIYNSFPKAILKDTVAYAHSKGMRVSGHVPAFLRAQDVVDAGFDEIQHINQLLLNFLVNDKTDTRTLERFYLPAREVADLDFDSAPVQAFIKELAAKKIEVDPTLATFDFIRQRAGQVSQAYVSVAPHFPPALQRRLRVAEMDIPDDATAARYDKSYAKMIDFVGRMYRAGVPVLAGTDAMPGFTLQRELKLYTDAGIPAPEVLRLATFGAAEVARVADDRGVIEPGKRADLLLVDGDPTRNIDDLQRVALVIKGQTAYDPSAVLEAHGIQPFTRPVALGRTAP